LARHGSNVAASGSHINNSYGVYIDSLTTANTTIDNLFGLYQSSRLQRITLAATSASARRPLISNSRCFREQAPSISFAASQAGVSNGYTIISDGTNLTHQWYNGAGEAMRLNSNGNVGIGTTSPNFNSKCFREPAPRISLRLVRQAFSNGYTIVSDGTNLTHQWYNGAGEAMRLNSNGNIGIGQSLSTVQARRYRNCARDRQYDG